MKKKLTAKDVWNNSIDFIYTNKRYFLAGIVFICIIYILTFCVGKNVDNSDPLSGIYQSFHTDENAELNSLIQNYYSAYASGDTTLLGTYATPISDTEAGYIQCVSQYIESFQSITVYSKPGAKDGEYLVSVSMEEKFVGVDTAAPGLDFFYVRTNADTGALYIDNNYSSFNQTNNETEMDPDIVALIQAYVERSDVIALSDQVQKNCDDAFNRDPALKEFVNTTLADAINKWKSEYQTKKAQEEAIAEQKAKEEAEKKEQEEKEAAEKAEREAKEAEEEANAKTGTITEKVKVRSSASKDGDSIGTIDGGTTVKVYSVEDGWCKIDYNGTRAYVKSDYVSISDDAANQETTQETATEDTQQQAQQQTTTVVLSKNVNVREQASENATKVVVAAGGTEITILEDAGNGWSKVSYKGKEGFAKTEYLN